jgi:hypothetical protein
MIEYVRATERFSADLLEVLEAMLRARIGWADALVTPFAVQARQHTLTQDETHQAA